jgi:uncharacterized protein (DUF305 family)
MTDMGMMGDHHNQGMVQGMSQGMGMMNIDALKTAKDFDKEFVRQMIPHHQMAVKIAQMVSERATHPEIRTLAQSIIKSQNAEIAIWTTRRFLLHRIGHFSRYHAARSLD